MIRYTNEKLYATCLLEYSRRFRLLQTIALTHGRPARAKDSAIRPVSFRTVCPPGTIVCSTSALLP